ncbi:MAG: alpha/beta hydrolase [Candidatus Angelobacter sp.]|nr:alpha/beta hydrolase [Candidatus Angelobacter sp.]
MLPTYIETLKGGRKIRVARMGSGQPLLLLHGYPDNLQIWCELAPRLATTFEVIAVDWPGMGESDPWPGGATPMHLGERIGTLLDHWKVKRAHLIAMDMGAQPALAYAAQNPQRAVSVVVMNSLVLWDEETSWEISLLRKFGWNRFILRNLPRVVFARAERTFLRRGTRLPAELRADFWNSFSRAEVRSTIAKMCAGYQGTLSRLPDLYKMIERPTLVLWAENDKHFPVEQARRLHALIAHSQLQIVPRGEHWMAWSMAKELATRIHVFLKSLECHGTA